MNWSEERFLFLDCQTTGMRPPKGQILELAWSYARVSDPEPSITSYLLKLPDDHGIPKRVQEITGIRPEQMVDAREAGDVFHALQSVVRAAPPELAAVIHYAQFEVPFLADLFLRFEEGTPLPFAVFCSHQISKRLLPEVPSQNIRAVAGFFGAEMRAVHRAASHVRATWEIWRGLVQELDRQGVRDQFSLREWLHQKPTPASTPRYSYRLDKLKRLQLPNAPGIYRMMAKSGEVLYVGKATSLKDRVNSYFRGKKGRDRRKLEMLAQVWDLRVTTCGTPLEAALLETDEIKRFNPPYNVVLKRGQRQIFFYSRDFSSRQAQQDSAHPIGPFRAANWIEPLRLLAQSVRQNNFEPIFYQPIEPTLLQEGFQIFCASHQRAALSFTSVRSLLAYGYQLHRRRDHAHEVADERDSPPQEDKVLSAEDVAGKFERLLARAAAETWRARRLTQLLNADLVLHLKEGPRALHLRYGKLVPAPAGPPMPFKPLWQNLNLDDFDRMSILLSELQKYNHDIGTNAHKECH